MMAVIMNSMEEVSGLTPLKLGLQGNGGYYFNLLVKSYRMVYNLLV